MCARARARVCVCVCVCARARVCAIPGCQCTHFDPLLPDNTTKYVCTGSTAVLPWTVTLDQGDEIVDIQWYFRGRSDEMIAMFAHGNFLAMPAFSARIRHMPNAGVAVSHVTPSDSGRYYVQIMGRNSLGFFSLLHEATLVVTGSLCFCFCFVLSVCMSVCL